MRWMLGVVTAIVATLSLTTPVMAGGWATTLVDPLPDQLAAGHTYTVGFWILQHGSHVSQITLSNPGLRLVDGKGQTLIFKGVPLPEGGHYATAIVLPHEGDWELFGMQAPFADYRVGVLGIPGRVVVGPTPHPLDFPPDPSWSTVKPPSVAGEVVPSPNAVAANQGLKPSASSPPIPWAPLGIGVLFGLASAILGSAAGRTALGRHVIGRLRTQRFLRAPVNARQR